MWSLLCSFFFFQGSQAFTAREHSDTGRGASRLSVYSLSTHSPGLPLMAARFCPPSLSVLSSWSELVCVWVCVLGWTGGGFYSLPALMLLEIRMLTQSLIWLHRSRPSQRNHINTNSVRYKPGSSLYPPLRFLHLLLCQCWFKFE